MKNTPYPCCKHSVKLSHCYFHKIYQFYLYTSSDKSFYVAQNAFLQLYSKYMLHIIMLLFHSKLRVRKTFKKYKNGSFRAPTFDNQCCQLTARTFWRVCHVDYLTQTNQSTVLSKFDVECQNAKMALGILKVKLQL